MKNLALFFVGVRKEMAQVRWPNKREMVKFSVAVISLIIVFALFFAASDFLLAALMEAFS